LINHNTTKSDCNWFYTYYAKISAKNLPQAASNTIKSKMADMVPTFGQVHGVEAAQQIPDKQVVPFHFTEPVITGEVEPQVRSCNISHHHSVQEPAGIQTCVIMFYPTGVLSINQSINQ
jgi:hypothetical protein